MPELGVFVPLPGVPEEAKNQCEEAPCEPAQRPPHDHVQLPHRQEGPLPLAVLRPLRRRLHVGIGGPMQTLGYMDGFIDVV